MDYAEYRNGNEKLSTPRKIPGLTRVHDVTLKLFGDRLPEFEIYFAGPAAMAKAIQQMLVESKVPLQQVHFDQFY